MSNSSFSQTTKLTQIYFGKTKSIKAEYYVLKKSKEIKHGEYKSYYLSGKQKEEGLYSNNQKEGEWLVYDSTGRLEEVQFYKSGQKTGIWKKYIERGQVIKKFDYENNKALDPLIYVPCAYPPIARENGIEGVVELDFIFDDNCILQDIKIFKSPGDDFDKSAIDCAKKTIQLIAKYFPNKCIKESELLPYTIRFSLQ